MILHEHPGERPVWRGHSHEPGDEFERRLRLWQERLLMWGFQDMKLQRALEREEKRQDTMERFGMDRVVATRELLRRRKR